VYREFYLFYFYCSKSLAAEPLGFDRTQVKNHWFKVYKAWRTMEAPLRHNNYRHLTLVSNDNLANMSIRIQDTTYFAVFLQTILGSNPAICFCYLNTEGRLHRTSLVQGKEAFHIRRKESRLWKCI